VRRHLHGEYAGNSALGAVIRASVNNLAGVPSIVFGLFGWASSFLFPWPSD